jgi:hypothetical protein
MKVLTPKVKRAKHTADAPMPKDLALKLVSQTTRTQVGTLTQKELAQKPKEQAPMPKVREQWLQALMLMPKDIIHRQTVALHTLRAEQLLLKVIILMQRDKIHMPMV